MKFTVTETPHLHRLIPASVGARRDDNRFAPPKRVAASFNQISISVDGAMPAFTSPDDDYLFWIDDTGNVYYGVDEETAVRLDHDLTHNPMIVGRDLSNAFLLGMAVAHLQHTEFTDCKPVALQLLNERGNAIQH